MGETLGRPFSREKWGERLASCSERKQWTQLFYFSIQEEKGSKNFHFILEMKVYISFSFLFFFKPLLVGLLNKSDWEWYTLKRYFVLFFFS